MAKLRVGLTGGIGSGKSELALAFAERGATIVDADVIAREIAAPGTPGLAAIAESWPEVIGEDGALDRAALAKIVFNDAAARARVNAITHPLVRARADELEREAGDGVIIHVVPLLFEGDYWHSCDKTVLVVAPEESRIDRVVTRDETDRAAVEKRIAAQIAPEEARQRADYVIENDGDLETLRERANRCYDALLRDLYAIDDLPHVLVRPMRRADIERADLIIRAAYGLDEPQNARLENHFDQRRGRPLVAEIDGEVVGFVHGNDYGRSAYVSLMAVDPSHQHRGVGGALMRSILAWAGRREFRDIRLDATPAGAKLYERFGFADVDETYVYRREPALGPVPAPSIRRTNRGDLVTLFALDAAALDADRAPMLDPLVTANETFVDTHGRGFAVLQRRGAYAIFGPWIARDPDVADALMHAVLREAIVPMLAYPPAANPTAIAILESVGFVRMRSLRHMIRGEHSAPSGLLYGRANLGQG